MFTGPNIVVFTGNHSGKGAKMFNEIKKLVCKESYAVYNLDFKKENVVAKPWYKGSNLVIVHDTVWGEFRKFEQYFYKFITESGRVLLDGMVDLHFDELTESFNTKITGIEWGEVKNNELEKMNIHLWKGVNNGALIVCENFCESHEKTEKIVKILELKLNDQMESSIEIYPIVVYGCNKQVNTLFECLKKVSDGNNDSCLELIENGHFNSSQFYALNAKSVDPENKQFNFEVYKKNLETRKIGQIVLHCKRITTTLDVYEKYPSLKTSEDWCERHILVASVQTMGKGRSENVWLSPEGCLMFTFPFSIDFNSKLINHVSLLQHVLAVSVILGIRSIPGLDILPLRVKWPNDIYYEDKQKLGGILVKASSMGNTLSMLLSCGINILNEIPTTSLKNIIKDREGLGSISLSLEEILARTLNNFEMLIDSINCGNVNDFITLYNSLLIGMNDKITVVDCRNTSQHPSPTKPTGIITGIEESGYLKIKLDFNNEIVSVQPDGNSFDASHEPRLFVNN